MNAARAEAWLRRFLRAYRRGEPEEIRAIFSPGASFRSGPNSRLYEGRERLIGYWLGEPVGAGFRVRARLLAFDPSMNVAVFEWNAHYPNAPEGYGEVRSVLVARFDRFWRCTRLEEWGRGDD